MSASARPPSTELRGIGSDAQPVDEALLEVLGHAAAAPMPDEEHAGGHEAGDEEVDVGDRSPASIAPPKT